MVSLKTLILATLVLLLTACGLESHSGVSASLKNYLADTKLSCEELAAWDFSKGFLVKSDLDGWGVLIISKADKAGVYSLSLVSHGHEHAYEERVVDCP